MDSIAHSSTADQDAPTVDTDSLRAIWTQTTARFLCQANRREDLSRLPRRLRGALGNALAQAASPQALDGQPCPWHPPCAYDLLFRERKIPGGRTPMAKPYVLSVERAQENPAILDVRVTLFGLAGDWMGAVAEAMATVLSGKAPRQGGTGIRLHVLDRVIGIETPPDRPLRRTWPTGAHAAVHFETPVQFRSGSSTKVGLEALPLRIADRLRDLAPWFGVRYAPDWSAINAVAYRTQDEAAIMTTEDLRTSFGQGGRVIPVTGYLGPVFLERPAPLALDLLDLGRLCHVGSHTALGQGRFSVHPIEGERGSANHVE
jgi:hypothetical protein